jgi:hypothetical protein
MEPPAPIPFARPEYFYLEDVKNQFRELKAKHVYLPEALAASLAQAFLTYPIQEIAAPLR